MCFAHGESSCHGRKPSYFEWIREDYESEICFFTDYLITHVLSSPYKKNIGWLIEPPSINPRGYESVKTVKDRYDVIFTYSQELIESDPEKFKWYPHAGCWIDDKDIKIWPKSSLCSIIASNKQTTTGHKLRHSIIKEMGNNIDVYGRGINDLEFKIDGLSKYRFSVVVENIKYDDYFTEKIIDCFATGTIPIYWGTHSVKNFFDENGIIFFETVEELKNILDNLTEEDYINRMEAIKNNLDKSKEFILAEDWIFKNYTNYF